MNQAKPSKRRLEVLIAAGALAMLLLGCVVVLRPFWSALVWAVVLAFSLYPLQRLFTRWLGGSRTWAACLVTLTVAVVLAGPLVWVGFSLAGDGKELAGATRKWFMQLPDEPPQWLSSLPVVGEELGSSWTTAAERRRHWMEQIEKGSVVEPPRAVPVSEDEANAPGDTAGSAPPAGGPPVVAAGGETTRRSAESQGVALVLGRLLGSVQAVLITIGKTVGQGVMVFLMSSFLAFFLLRDGETLANRLSQVVDRLSAGRGKHLMQVAGLTVKGVIYGILGTALVQGMVAGLGFWIASVPGAILLGVLTFLVALIPFGPPLVWIPAAIWLFSQGRVGWGIFMALWGVCVISAVDNVVRPMLISQGSKLPFVLIFCGVIGGAVGFGLVGVFLGPTLLAVAYRLIEEWSLDPTGENTILPLSDVE